MGSSDELSGAAYLGRLLTVSRGGGTCAGSSGSEGAILKIRVHNLEDPGHPQELEEQAWVPVSANRFPSEVESSFSLVALPLESIFSYCSLFL